MFRFRLAQSLRQDAVLILPDTAKSTLQPRTNLVFEDSPAGSFLGLPVGRKHSTMRTRRSLFPEIGYRGNRGAHRRRRLGAVGHADAQESACATLEEHLLICPECRNRLKSTGEFVAAIGGGSDDVPERYCQQLKAT